MILIQYHSVGEGLNYGTSVSWRRKWQPTPVFLPREFHGQRNLVGYIVQGVTRVGHDLATKPPPRPYQEYCLFACLLSRCSCSQLCDTMAPGKPIKNTTI